MSVRERIGGNVVERLRRLPVKQLGNHPRFES